MEFNINHPILFVLAGVIVLAVLAQSVFFLMKAWRRGLAIGMERAKLRRIIDDLEDEIALQMCTIGELVYATHRGNPSDSDTMQKILEYVDDLEGEIEGHEQQLKLLLGIVPCPICGKDIALDDVFCQNCGQALPVPSDRTI